MSLRLHFHGAFFCSELMKINTGKRNKRELYLVQLSSELLVFLLANSAVSTYLFNYLAYFYSIFPENFKIGY